MPGHTWCDAKNEPESRIDYVFFNESLVYTISYIKARIIPGTHSKGCRMSDHIFLKFWINYDKTKRSP